MANANNVYEVKCPSCGAPLYMTGDRVICEYCGAVVERARPAAPQPEPQATAPNVVVIKTDFSTHPAKTKSGCGASCLTLLVMLLMIGGVIYFVFGAQLYNAVSVADLVKVPTQIAAATSHISVNDVFLTENGPAAPELMTFTYDSQSQEHRLTYVETISSSARWHSPSLAEWYASRLIQSAGQVFLTDKSGLLALNRADGQVIWRTSLADTLAPSCSNCLLLFDKALVALVQGGTVQGFDPQTGQLTWSRRLNGEYINRLTQAGNQLILFDRSQDNRDDLMTLVNPANGETVTETTIPRCADERFEQYYPNFYQPELNELYLIFGDTIGPACVQVWNLAGPQITRQIRLDNIALPSNFREYDYEQNKAIMVNNKLYFAAMQTNNGRVEQNVMIELTPTDGNWRIIGGDPDYQLIPLTVADNLLIVRAERSRGTARSELWGLDLASGQKRWQYVLQAPRWYKESGSEPLWDWQLTPHGLVVLQLFSDPNQLLVENLNPQTGVSSGQNTLPLENDDLSGLAWSPDSVWLAMDNIFAVDLKSGTVAHQWP